MTTEREPAPNPAPNPVHEMRLVVTADDYDEANPSSFATSWGYPSGPPTRRRTAAES